ncbi:DUF3347 domain-containing protein [Fulvivirga lutimaris]|uniref:DUF3347 domain-containing protein n=1 Tax=Fulvivirga lutimaris TaxID=1819566 RepID=UPI0012BC3004|nr:DUF3347 domain-containing protein [Fulvivirga lutimaris]MTI41426.1 DUF3347 domain-containing protein [Fulvivirga lutimaris]
MKTKMNAMVIMAFFAACGTPKQENTTEETATTEVAAEPVNEKDEVVEAYIKVKDALVATDMESTKNAAEALHHTVMSDESLKSLADATMAVAQGEDIEAQRVAFQTLTAEFISYAKTSNPSVKLYVQFCPMAFDNTGANWVSTSSEIRNPYFGDKMLKCGRVDEEI